MAVEAQQQPVASMVDADETEDSSPKPLRRACDCCRKRKVKCDGSIPCVPCKKASIKCAYLQPPKKKGPKGLRSARVLHALRRIDDRASAGPASPLSPFRDDWDWAQTRTPANGNGVYYHEQRPQPAPHQGYPPHTTMPPNHDYFPQVSTSMPLPQPQQQQYPHPAPVPQRSQDSYVSDYSSGAAPAAAYNDVPRVMSPIRSESLPLRIHNESFRPYVQLFYDHMFAIMPIIDRDIYLDPSFYRSPFSSEMYCFLCSICAATIVQLDESIPQPPPLHPNKRTDDFFMDECLRERKNYDYIEKATTLSIMTAFFMFAYYGNHEKHAKAWHYLQESITFAENLNMEDESSYVDLAPVEAQWRRRLYWLLFITERAYAVQRRKHTRLQASVQLPAVFDSEDPQLLNGFVNLANLFAAVDDNFVRAWRGSRRQSLCNEAWLAQTQKQLDAAASSGNITETQHMDIGVTREWLHMLAWQMGVSNGLMWGKGEGGGGGMRLEYPVELARKVVEITAGANALALDSHGIGMEQKLSDIAGCLADVLRCIAGDNNANFHEGKHYLDILIQRLSSMRGKESRYLRPLMSKVEGLVGYELGNQTLPLPTEYFGNMQQRLSMSVADSFSMLRTLSMGGSFGMPSLTVPGPGPGVHEDWGQRRPSGRVLGEDESVVAVDTWWHGHGNGLLQAV